MNIFLRTHRKNVITSKMVLPLKKFSSANYRSYFALKYRLDSHGPKFYNSRNTLISNYQLLPALTKIDHHHNDYTLQQKNTYVTLSSPYNYIGRRYIHLGETLNEQPSSKVEETVQNMKNKQKEKVEEIIKEATAGTKTDQSLEEAAQKQVVVKKPLKTVIWEEIVHYYHGFRLLFIDINICRKLLWRVLKGKTLTRRENKLLVRTTSDLFRLIPFSVFIIVPFMELALPLFIKFFPGMLPSTFQTSKDREDKLKQALQVRLEMAKFLQRTLDEMTVQHKEHESEEAKQFELFFKKIKKGNEHVSNEDIIKFAKRFEDEITLDSLSGDQLSALCRVLELNTVGTSNWLRFQLRLKLRSLAADDRVIEREGVNSLDLWELQQACKARGMRAYGLTKERMQKQLQEWIDLSLSEKVPPTLLLLSRAVSFSDESITTDKLKETLRVLPDSLTKQAKAAIGELEGKIDNKVKVEIIKEEVRKIQEELEEERQEAKAQAKAQEQAKKEELLDKAKVVKDVSSEYPDADKVVTDNIKLFDSVRPKITSVLNEKETAKQLAEEKSISSKDVELLSDALKTLSTDKDMVVEKETIKDLKTELQEYKEDVEELREVRQVVQEPVRESRAAKMLFNKVNSMIGQLDKVLSDLEEKQKKVRATDGTGEELIKEQAAENKIHDDIVQIDELVHTIKQLQQTSNESRLKQIENILSKLDADKDGAISVDEVLNVVEAIGRENVKLNEKQLEELIALLDKEQLIEAEEKIEKAIAKSIKADEAKKVADETKKVAEQLKTNGNDINVSNNENNITPNQPQHKPKEKCDDDLKDTAKDLKDNALNLDEVDKKNLLKTDKKSENLLDAVEKQKDKILPPADIMPPTPPTPPTLPPSSNQTNTKDKMI